MKESSQTIEEYEEIVKFLFKPFLYAAPYLADTFEQKYSEFNKKQSEGIQYDQSELVKIAFRSARRLVGYIAKEAGGSGLIKKMLLKNAGEYATDVMLALLFGSEK